MNSNHEPGGWSTARRKPGRSGDRHGGEGSREGSSLHLLMSSRRIMVVLLNSNGYVRI